MFAMRWMILDEAANFLQDKGAKILGDGKPKIGAHGNQFYFYIQKNFLEL